MTKRIFKSVLMASLAVFLVALLLIMGMLYEYFSAVQQSQLNAQTQLAARGVESLGEDYLNGLNTGLFRITRISPDGSVLYDSISDSENMENHLHREEIRMALETGHGESSRYSSTLLQRYLYSAQLLEDGSVLRLSVAHNSVFVLLFGMLQPVLIVILVAVILSFLLARGLSQRIVEPLNRLNLDDPISNEDYGEIAPLLRRIHSQQQQLSWQKSRLQQKQDEFNTIVSRLEEGMLLLDKNLCVITANPAAARMLDFQPAAAQGLPLLNINRNLPLQEALNEALQNSNASRKTVFHGKTVQIQAAAISSEGEISGVAAVLFDITGQETADRQRREFTANVSHELKTPLQSISGYSELLECGMVKAEDVPSFGKRIHSESVRLIKLVEDIIGLSRLDAGIGYEFSVLDLYDHTENAVRELASVASEKGIELCLGGESALIFAAPELVHGIVYNLCDNAIKYNRPGGSVSVEVGSKNGRVVLSVKDTGIGIPEEELGRIFERFYRVDKGRSKEVGGTGLGLSIVKHAAMLTDAEISVNSKPGEGSAITVSFPLKNE